MYQRPLYAVLQLVYDKQRDGLELFVSQFYRGLEASLVKSLGDFAGDLSQEIPFFK